MEFGIIRIGMDLFDGYECILFVLRHHTLDWKGINCMDVICMKYDVYNNIW